MEIDSTMGRVLWHHRIDQAEYTEIALQLGLLFGSKYLVSELDKL